jgi:hypothetical protein
MGAFNAQLVDTGALLDANGFLPSSKGSRVLFAKDTPPQVKKGPFALENLVAGYWILQLESIEQAIEWAKKIPFREGSVDIRKIADEEDFGDAMTEELKGQQEEMRRKQAEYKK